MTGKDIRLGRFLGGTGRSLIVPIDQSITSGPISGLFDMRATIRKILDGRPNGVLMHRGPVMAGLWIPGTSSGLIIHLSAGTEMSPDCQVKTLACSVEESLELGADGVSVHVSLGMGNERDNRSLADLGRVSGHCVRWGVPLMAMMYVYGREDADRVKSLAHAARIGGELGADWIKINYTGDPDSFGRIVDSSYARIIMAGGPSDGTGHAILRAAQDALHVGAAGVCIGRNVYQHAEPAAMVRALSSVVHEGRNADEAYADHILSRSLVAELDMDDHDLDLTVGHGEFVLRKG